MNDRNADNVCNVRTDHRKGKFYRILRHVREKRVRYLFILPAFVWFFIFCYLPMGGLLIVFKDYSVAGGILGSEWASPITKNFEMFFDNPLLGDMIRNTVLVSLLKLLTGFPAPVVFAILLNECKFKRFRGVTQVVSYLPHLISWVMLVAMLNSLFSPTGQGGPLYTVVQMLTGNKNVTYYLLKKEWFLPVTLFTNIWKGMGWNSIIYLAAIKGINAELYEAAEIDGASRLQQIWHVMLPGILPTMCLLFIMSLGGLASAGYEQIYLLQSPNNLELSNVLDVYVVTVGLNQGNYEIAAVAGMFQSVFALLLTVVGNFVVGKLSDNSLW